ncbi:Fic family protein [Leifsonia sp. NPDC058292]|uniref:Fic family protein n=1 Tax=Leifsonia sp. NPDC058292 TaxID=3346428 RepID=UPI0036DBAF2D
MASHALGRLEQGARLVPNPALLRRPTLQREAQSTSALEGTYAPIEEVMAADLIDSHSRSSALREVINYIVAAERAFDWIDSGRTLTIGLLGELHQLLVSGTAADTEEAGRIRKIQVVIGSRGGSVYDARFIPAPTGTTLHASVQDLIDWMRPDGGEGINSIVKAAMAHYQFETLHQFNDGNGRIGRLLIVLQLVTDGLIGQGLLSVSPWFERRREQYQDLLSEVSASGDWDSWIDFFARGIESSARDTASRMSELLEVQAHYHAIITESGTRGVVRDIADVLIGSPYVTIPFLVSQTGKTYPAVKTAVARLIELGVLEERPGASPHLFRAPLVVAVTSRPSTAEG